MENIKVDVIIPAYHPGKEFSTLIERLTKQTFPIHRIIVMNTEETYWNKELEEKFSILEVHHLKKQEFDHGATRAWAAELSDADVMVFMTQDAVPADRNLIENLVKARTLAPLRRRGTAAFSICFAVCPKRWCCPLQRLSLPL